MISQLVLEFTLQEDTTNAFASALPHSLFPSLSLSLPSSLFHSAATFACFAISQFRNSQARGMAASAISSQFLSGVPQ